MNNGIKNTDTQELPTGDPRSQPVSRLPKGESGSSRKRTNKGCWILVSIGCFLTIILSVVLVGLFVMVLVGDWNTGSVSENILHEGSSEKIAVVRIDGAITESSSSGGLVAVDGTAADLITNQLDKALYDESVRGVLVRMNSPGGEVVASDLIYRKVKDLSTKKPVVTWISGMGASGGYMVAAGSDIIIAHPSAITGSIGVILEVTSLEGLYEKLGIESRIFKTGEFKDDSGIFDEDPNGEADMVYQQLIDESYEHFVNIVSESRGMEIDAVKTLADGRIYSGTQAVSNGLIDDVGDMDDAIMALETRIGNHGLTVVEYSTGGFWSSFYEYQNIIIGKLDLLSPKEHVGAVQYYLLNL